MADLKNNHSVENLAELTMFLQRHFLISLTHQTSVLKLSIPQYTLLGFLSAKGPLTMGHLAALMGHSTPAATGLVDRLCKANLVRRTSSTEDRRQVHVEITDNGKVVVENARQELINCLNEISARLSPEDQQAWVRIYETMHHYCEQKRANS
ncbi:MAG: MarR family transcriptional regulator [Verrucomicrobiota bacterium]